MTSRLNFLQRQAEVYKKVNNLLKKILNITVSEEVISINIKTNVLIFSFFFDDTFSAVAEQLTAALRVTGSIRARNKYLFIYLYFHVQTIGT